MEKYKEAFINALELNESEIAQIHELEYKKNEKWDSLGHMKLMCYIENSLKISLKTEDILQFTSYTKGIEILKKYRTDIF